MKREKIVFRIGETIQVISKATTTNDKIEGDKKRRIVQTYTFDKRQFDLVRSGVKGMIKFFNKAKANCMDCPFNSFGKCYTHKFNQYVGFVSMLKSISTTYKTFNSIPEYSHTAMLEAMELASGTYVRFGTYGEPSLHPLEMIEGMTAVATNWTGYTHQWFRYPELGKYLMASTHNVMQDAKAKQFGYRSFIASDTKIDGVVNCPASKESGYKSTCSKCGLCSGTKGKGNKSVYILTH